MRVNAITVVGMVATLLLLTGCGNGRRALTRAEAGDGIFRHPDFFRGLEVYMIYDAEDGHYTPYLTSSLSSCACWCGWEGDGEEPSGRVEFRDYPGVEWSFSFVSGGLLLEPAADSLCVPRGDHTNFMLKRVYGPAKERELLDRARETLMEEKRIYRAQQHNRL